MIDGCPHRSNYYHSQGSIFRRLKKPKKALESYRKAVVLSKSRDIVCLSSYAQQLLEIGEPEEALKYARKAYQMDPSDTQVISVLVDVHSELGDMETALGLLEKAIHRRRTDRRLHARAGMLAKKMGDMMKAKSHFEQAVVDPGQPHTLISLADVYINLGKFDLAKTTLEQYPAKAHRDASYWSTRANIMRHMDKLKEASMNIETAIAKEDNNPVHRGGAAQIQLDWAKKLMSAGEREEALLKLEAAKEQVRVGLEIDNSNVVLKTIQRAIDRAEQLVF